MKKGIAVILAASLAAAAGGGVFYQFVYRGANSREGGRVSSSSEDAVYVDSVRMLAGLENSSGTIQRYAGVVEPQQTWEAKLENERTVKTTYVKEGDSVKAGDRLFAYDTSEDEDKLAQDQIDLERLDNELVGYRAMLEQYKKQEAKATGDDKVTATTSVLTQENAIKQAEYEIKSKELEISQLQTSIKNAEVTCELDGVVKSVAKTGNASSGYGSSESDAYITVMAVGEYRVKATINEQNLNEIYEGQEMIAFSRVDDQKWTGVLTEIKTDSGQTNQNDSWSDSSSDSGTSSTNYPFYVELEDSDGLILGQHVYLEADEGQTDRRDGIWLPSYYFTIEEDGSAWIWAASDQNVLEKRQVTLGAYDEMLDNYQIEAGLTAEDYVTTPNDMLSEGLPVIYMDNAQDVTGESVFGQNDQWDDGSWDDGSWDDSFWEDEEWDEEEEVWEDSSEWENGSLGEEFYDEVFYDEND